MITECMIFLASILPMGMDEAKFIENHLQCNKYVPESMQQYAEYYVEHFDRDNIDKAVRIGWCESRGKQSAYRDDNGDSGLMQFVSWTWNWVAEEYDLPKWNTWVITYKGYPYNGHPKDTPTDLYNIEFTKVQFSPYYNILFASILAEDIYGRTQWRDWNSSKWCWADKKEWREIWLSEQF